MTLIVDRGRRPRYVPTGHLVYLTAPWTMMAAPFDPARLELVGEPIAIADSLWYWSIADDGKLFYSTIEAQGDRGEEEEPFVYQTGQVTVSNKLAGSSRVKLIVDRHTGWLRHKEQKTSLSGQIKQSRSGPQDTETAIDATMEITTLVAPVE